MTELKVGDTVDVLNAIRLPHVEQVIHTGVIERVQHRDGLLTLYWIAGRLTASTARVLRKHIDSTCYPSPCCGVESRIVSSTPSAVTLTCGQCGKDFKA